jgi:hypothetical protein
VDCQQDGRVVTVKNWKRAIESLQYAFLQLQKKLTADLLAFTLGEYS